MAKVRPLPPALAEAAKRELFEVPERLEADLQHLKDWLAKQPHLKARTDDQFLVAFLRGSKFSLERAKEKLDAYYTLRSALPDFFKNRDPTCPKIRKIMELGVFLPLGVDGEGRRVILFRGGAYDPNEVDINDVFKANMMMVDVMVMEDDALIVKGQVGIMDMSNMTVAHATHMTPSLAKKSMTVFQEGYPLRPKAMHYLHMKSIFESIFNLFKTFMKEKLRNRVHVHSDLNTFYQSVPKEILPKEYGGNAGTIKEISEEWQKKLEAWRQYFAEDDQFCAVESKRPGRPKTHQDLFGLEGSFRPLAVD
ncbi:hypothetical protein R5R35_006319 [Gryllus longicercus]|uniref:CRAL-TRIO domain-containing protein n=1 Tax=Gryllus longicercus TaxID=2509291 RepID=A0AAN9VBT9_9ORTH